MSAESIASYVTRSFENYAAETPSNDLCMGANPVCVADFIRGWAESGRGVRACQGDFQTFTIAIITIVDKWLNEPGFLDYETEQPNHPETTSIKRHVETIFGNAGYKHRILDPHFFAACTFQELHGRGDHSGLFAI
jgi:hypothetical protein